MTPKIQEPNMVILGENGVKLTAFSYTEAINFYKVRPEKMTATKIDGGGYHELSAMVNAHS